MEEEYIPPSDEDLPTGWARAYDERYNEYYFYCEETNVSQWEFPTQLAVDTNEALEGTDMDDNVSNPVFGSDYCEHITGTPIEDSSDVSMYVNPFLVDSMLPAENLNDVPACFNLTDTSAPDLTFANSDRPIVSSEDEDDCDISRRPAANISSILLPASTNNGQIEQSHHQETHTDVLQGAHMSESGIDGVNDISSNDNDDGEKEYSDMDSTDSSGSYSDVDRDYRYCQHHQDPSGKQVVSLGEYSSGGDDEEEVFAYEFAEEEGVEGAAVEERVPPLQLRRLDDQNEHPHLQYGVGPGPGIPASELDYIGRNRDIDSQYTQGALVSRGVECKGPGGMYFEGRTHDYLAMAKIYKVIRKFSRPTAVCECILCHEGTCHNVFFPCQHRCVCNACMVNECIVDDVTFLKNNEQLAMQSPDDLDSGSGHCNCPLCGEIIKKILPHEFGKEVDVYWDWVLGVRPKLPYGFMKKFNHSAGVIQAVYVNPAYRTAPEAGSFAAATAGMGEIPTTLTGLTSLINNELIKFTSNGGDGGDVLRRPPLSLEEQEERAAAKILRCINREAQDGAHVSRSSSSVTAARRKKRLHKRRTNEFIESLKLKDDDLEEQDVETGTVGTRSLLHNPRREQEQKQEECSIS